MKSPEVQSTPEWVDTTSYSRNERENAPPRAWTLQLPNIKILVHKFMGSGDEWFYSCYDLNVEKISLGTKEPKIAQKLALQLAQHHVAKMLDELTNFRG